MKLMKSLGKNPRAPSADNPAFEIAFETDDVARDYEQALVAGAVARQEPADMPWGQTVSYVSAAGVLVEICSPVAETPSEE